MLYAIVFSKADFEFYTPKSKGVMYFVSDTKYLLTRVIKVKKKINERETHI